jgi:IS30 family transposase
MAATVHKLPPTNLEIARRLKNYRFEDDVDPAMQELCDMIVQSGLSVQDIVKRVQSTSGGQVRVAHSTIDNWLSGKTRRPQNFTLTWVGYALGYVREWKKV